MYMQEPAGRWNSSLFTKSPTIFLKMESYLLIQRVSETIYLPMSAPENVIICVLSEVLNRTMLDEIICYLTG